MEENVVLTVPAQRAYLLVIRTALGGVALEKLTEAILASGTLEGVDVVTGATWTSKGAFAAIKKAMGVEEESAQTAAEAVSATGLSHGLGLASTPRLARMIRACPSIPLTKWLPM